jgi:hypothetical protein
LINPAAARPFGSSLPRSGRPRGARGGNTASVPVDKLANQGPPEDFAMVVPVPVVLKKEQVKTLAPDVFQHIDQLSAPRLVEYWEQDPCYEPLPVVMKSKGRGMAAMADTSVASERAADYGVTIEAKFAVGEYEILILSAKESGGLETWLRLSKYNIPKGAAEALAPYIREQQKFFVAKVDIKNPSGN